MIRPIVVRELSLYGGQKTLRSMNFSRICSSSADQVSRLSVETMNKST